MNPAKSGKSAARGVLNDVIGDVRNVGRVAKAGLAKLTKREPPRAVTFLSGSLRSADLPLLDAFARYLNRRGFQCYTVGRTTSSAEPVEDAVRRLVDASDCLVGIATARFDATDSHGPGGTLRLVAGWVNQEPAMAFQARVPHLIFRGPDVTLQGVAESNLHIPFTGLKPNGRLGFIPSEAVVDSALSDLRERALAKRRLRTRRAALGALKTLSTFAVGGYLTVKVVEKFGRPSCFSTFDGYDPDCKVCTVRKECRVEKIRNS